MARLDNVGYDASGRLTVPEADASFPPEVRAIIEDFRSQVGW